MGFAVAPLVIPACALGHDHRRDRVWFLGHTDRQGEPVRAVNAEVAGLPRAGHDARDARVTNGLSTGLDTRRRRAIGNAVVPQIPELIGSAILAAEAQRQQEAA
jgi:DNA (cytosine-5)-methyltransferase 1